MHKQICHEIVALAAPKKRSHNVLVRLHSEEIDRDDDVVTVDVRVRKPKAIDIEPMPVSRPRPKVEFYQVGQNLDCYV
jgi:hypothetical protein